MEYTYKRPQKLGIFSLEFSLYFIKDGFFVTAYHVNWTAHNLENRMSLEWGSGYTFSPGQTSRSILKKTYPGYNKMF